MSKNWQQDLKNEITTEVLFLSRRKFIKLSALFGTAYALAACGITPTEQGGNPIATGLGGTPSSAPELTDVLTPYETITNYNNYYEFSFNKDEVAKRSANFVTSPWPIEI